MNDNSEKEFIVTVRTQKAILLLNELDKLHSNYLQFHYEYIKEDLLHDYIEEIEGIIGSLYRNLEEVVTTSILDNIQLCEKNNNTKTFLI